MMKISISADSKTGVATKLEQMLKKMGHDVILHGALFLDAPGWAPASVKTALDVAEGRADFGVVCCNTGTGATIAANKVPYIRAALCVDAYTASRARMWNDANVMGISLRLTTEQTMQEMLTAWFSASVDESQLDNIGYINNME